MNKGKIGKQDTFLFAWAIMLIYTLLLQQSELKYILPISLFKYSFSGISFVILLVKILYFDRFRKRELFFIFLVMILISLVSYKSSNINLILYYMFIISSQGISIERIVKLDMKIRITILILLFTLSMLGIISNYSRLINGVTKTAFGWSHPNGFCGAVVITIIEWIYLKWERFSIGHLIVAIGMVMLLLQLAASRTTLYAAMFVLVWVILVKNVKWLTSGALINRIYIWYTALMAGISWFLFYLYNKGTSIGIMLNQILTSRLRWAQSFYLRYGISLWGKDIETVSTRESLISDVTRQIFDMSYLRLPIEFGVAYTVFFFVAMFIITRYVVNGKRYRDLMLIIYFSTIGIGSTATINLFSNYVLLLFIPAIQNWKINRTTNTKQVLGMV